MLENACIRAVILSGCLVFVLLFTPSCQSKQCLAVYSNVHPESKVDFIDFEKYYQNQRLNAANYLGAENIMELHTYDRGYDISAYYIQSRLFVVITDCEGFEVTTVKTDSFINTMYIDFAFLDDCQIIAVALDSFGNTLIMNVTDNAITDYIGVESAEMISAIKSCKDGFILIGDHSISKYDSGFNLKNTFATDSVICGVAVFEDRIIVIESSYDKKQISNEDEYAYCYVFLCKVVNQSTLKTEKERSICQYTNNTAAYQHYKDVDVFAVDKDCILLSLREGIYEIDLVSGTTKPILNTFDYGAGSSSSIVFSGEKLMIQLSYFDIFDDKYIDVIAFVTRSESAKEKIVAGVLGDVDCESLFQYINRSKSDIYICIDKIGKDSFASGDYVNIVSRNDFDLVVFNDELKKPLLQNGYLLNINSYGFNKEVLSDNVSGLMEYYVFPEYSVKTYFYNTNYWKDDPVSYLHKDISTAKEIYANQSVQMIINEYYGIIQKELDICGQVSEITIKSLLELCSQYNLDYYESEPLVLEIMSGNLVYNCVSVSCFEELYSIYCHYSQHLGYCAPLGYDTPAIIPSYYIGISVNSSQISNCICILNMLIDNDIQDHMSFPVNKDSINFQMNNLMNNFDKEYAATIISKYPLLSDSENSALSDYYDEIARSIINGTNGEDKIPEFQPYIVSPLIDEKSLLDYQGISLRFITSSSDLYYVNMDIINILYEETNAFLYGTVDINQATAVLCDRINLYVAEVG